MSVLNILTQICPNWLLGGTLGLSCINWPQGSALHPIARIGFQEHSKAKLLKFATRGHSRGKLPKLATQGALWGQVVWIGHQGVLQGQVAQIGHQRAVWGQVAQIGHQVALQTQINHQSYKCPPKMFGGRGIVFGGQLSTLAVVEELLEDNCQFSHRQDLEDICFNILHMVENLNKSHF